MSKRSIRTSSDPQAKTMGRSHGKPVKDPILGDIVSPKIFAARKTNNPQRYKYTEAN